MEPGIAVVLSAAILAVLLLRAQRPTLEREPVPVPVRADDDSDR